MSGFEPRKAQLRPGGDELGWVVLGGRGSGKTAAMLGRIIDRFTEGHMEGRLADAVIYVGDVNLVDAARRYATALLDLGLVREARVSPTSGVQVVTDLGTIDIVDRRTIQAHRPLMVRHGVIAADDLERQGHYSSLSVSELMRLADLSGDMGARPEIIMTITPPLPAPKWLLNLLSSNWVTSTRLRTGSNTALNPSTVDALRDTYSDTRVGRATLDAEIIIGHDAEDEE